MLEKHGHGGDLRSATELYGITEQQLLDYSSNMNPLGPPIAFKKIIEEYWHQITAYPDPIGRDLSQAIARNHALAHGQVIVGNGAAELIDLIVRYLKPDKAALVVPSFKEYDEALMKIDCEIHYIEALEENNFVPTREQLLEAMEREQRDLFIFGYPNNPTGGLLPKEHLTALLERGANVIVDEAFLDFHRDEEQLTMITLLARYDGLFVIRSMTKMYSIPGIRLGYMLGAAHHIAAIKQLQYPWSVNSLAQRLGIQALKENDYVMRTRHWLHNEITWMTEQIQRLGLKPYPTVTSYMLVKLDPQLQLSSSQLQLLMGKQAILIRDGSTFRGLNDQYIRLAIKCRADNETLIGTLKETLRGFQGLREERLR